MMLPRQATTLRAPATRRHNIRALRLVRAVDVETSQRSEVKPAAGDTQGIQSTLSALDSLLPSEPAKQVVTPALNPTSSSSTSTAPANSSSNAVSSSSNPWEQLQKAAAAGKSGGRQSKQIFEIVMAFEGLAPEVINGRAAMLGFLFALINETHGDSLFSQLVAGGGVSALGVILFVILASFAPAARQVPFDTMFGKNKQPASFGPFTAAAELINGRAAMLGLLTLFFLEGTSGQPFFL